VIQFEIAFIGIQIIGT